MENIIPPTTEQPITTEPKVTVEHNMFPQDSVVSKVLDKTKDIASPIGKTYNSVKDFLANETKNSSKFIFGGGRDIVDGLELRKLGKDIYKNQDKLLGAIEPMNASANDGSELEYRPLPVPTEFQSVLEDSYKKNPQLPRGVLESTLMQESHFGKMTPQDTSGFEGNYGWMVGFRKSTADSIKKHLKQYPGDDRYSSDKFLKFDTPENAVKSMANWLAFRQKIWSVSDSGGPQVATTISNPLELYLDRYYGATKAQNPAEVERVKNSFQYYMDAYSKLHK